MGDEFRLGAVDDLLADDFRLGQLVRHFDDGAEDGFHFGVFVVLEILKPTTLGTIGHLYRNSIAIGRGPDKFLAAAHNLRTVEVGALEHGEPLPRKTQIPLYQGFCIQDLIVPPEEGDLTDLGCARFAGCQEWDGQDGVDTNYGWPNDGGQRPKFFLGKC